MSTPPDMDRTEGWKFLAAAGLVGAVWLTFAGVRAGGFIGIDDGNNIFLNPRLGVLSWERVVDFFRDFTSARRYMPAGWLGFSAVFSWRGLAPGGYHAASLAWHALAAVILFLTAHNILGRRLDPAIPGAEFRRLLAAALAAALWALHPLRTEAVAWASGLLYSQAAAFAFLSVWLWTLRWSAAGRAGWYAAGAAVALALSLLTYPLAFGVPVVCWLLDRAFGSAADQLVKSQRRFQVGVIAVVAVVALVATFVSRRAAADTFAGMPSLENFGWIDRIVQALYAWAFDLKVLLFPTSLSPVYTTLYQLHPAAREVQVTVALGCGLLLGVVVLARRHRALAGWTLAYTAMALPVLGLTEHPWITHDRYTGLLHPVLAIGLVHWLLGRRLARFFPYAAGLVVVAIVAAAMQARSLIGVWTDPWTYHARLEQTLPANAWAGYYLGKVPASVLFLDGRFDEIGPRLARAEARAPGWSAAPAKAEFDGLIREHREFLAKAWPGRTLAPLAVLHYLHGKTFAEGKDWLTACVHFQAAARADARFAEAGLEEAWCELELNHPAEARQCLEAAIAPPGALAFGARERDFWRLLAAVHHARGESSLEAATLRRARERAAGPAGP